MKRRTFLTGSLVASAPLATGMTPWGPLVATAAPTADPSDHPLVDIFTDRWATVPEVPSAPVLTGLLDDPLWQQAPVLGDFRTALHLTPVAQQTEVRLLHDQTSLVIGFSYQHDDAASQLAAVEFFLSTGPSAPYHRIPVPLRTGRLVPYVYEGRNLPSEATSAEVTGLTVHTAEDDDRVTLELAVPFAALGVGPLVGTPEWRFNVVTLHEMQTHPLGTWVPVRRSAIYWSGAGNRVDTDLDLVNEARLGTITLDRAAAQRRRTPLLTAASTASPTLEYLNVNELELSVPISALSTTTGIRLSWKAVHDDWVPVTGLSQQTVGDELRIRFTHPPVLHDGLHQIRLAASSGPESIITFDRDGFIAAGDQYERGQR